MSKTDTEIDTTSVPTDALADYLVALAREVGELRDYAEPPERGNDRDVDWSWPTDWEVESFPEKGELQVRGKTTGTYQRQVTRAVTSAPPEKCHPAEYETCEMPVGITIYVNLDEGHDLELGAPTIEVMAL
jgi:hypothetical protein